MKTITDILNDKKLILLDKFLRLFRRQIVVECDLVTREVSGWFIEKY